MVILNCFGTHKSCSTTWSSSLTKINPPPDTTEGFKKKEQGKCLTYQQNGIMEEVINKPATITDMRKRVKDIQMAISWRDFANTYFQRSSSWFYHKMDGIDGNGGVGGFSEVEALQMKGALIDLSDRIRRAADNI